MRAIGKARQSGMRLLSLVSIVLVKDYTKKHQELGESVWKESQNRLQQVGCNSLSQKRSRRKKPPMRKGSCLSLSCVLIFIFSSFYCFVIDSMSLFLFCQRSIDLPCSPFL